MRKSEFVCLLPTDKSLEQEVSPEPDEMWQAVFFWGHCLHVNQGAMATIR